jgi:hypothetical protein
MIYIFLYDLIFTILYLLYFLNDIHNLYFIFISLGYIREIETLLLIIKSLF